MPAARTSETLRVLAAAGSALACVGTVHQFVNQRRLRRPPDAAPPVDAAVSLLVPARNEAHRITPTIRSLLAQCGLNDVDIVVLDDRSTDGTADVVRAIGGAAQRVRVLAGSEPQAGWLGKPHACAQLAAAARGTVLVFVDADVVLAPDAVAAAIAVMRGPRPLDLLSPWPRQDATGVLGRLVQPLLAWSWLTTLPLRRAEDSIRPSMAVANGQFLLVEADALARAGGWAAVSGAILDDIAMARAVRATGGRTGVADGSTLATCHMYASGAELRAGYRKSLWAAFGSPVGALGVAVGLAVVYVLPAAAAVTGSRLGAIGYAAAVIGRVHAARWCRGQRWWETVGASTAHPLSVLALLGLLASSWVGRVRGSLSWKGRSV